MYSVYSRPAVEEGQFTVVIKDTPRSYSVCSRFAVEEGESITYVNDCCKKTHQDRNQCAAVLQLRCAVVKLFGSIIASKERAAVTACAIIVAVADPLSPMAVI